MQTSYTLIPLALLVLLTVSHPVAGILAFVTLASLSIALPRTARLLRCYFDCGAFVLDIGNRVEVTVTRPEATG